MKGGGHGDSSAPNWSKGADYEKLSAYYNLDNGTGKIRGVYMQGNIDGRADFQSVARRRLPIWARKL